MGNKLIPVVLGLSGGVDSAVTLGLLQMRGYRVTPVYLETGVSPDGVKDAEAVAKKFGVKLLVRDIRADLEAHVCAPFDAAYRAGRTPNPCILCNPAVKIRALIDCADELGIHWVSTGHYARTIDGGLYQGMPSNDQSYMLCRLLPEQVARLVLPLGNYEKLGIRDLAGVYNIPVADKPDSMEICFIPDKDYAGWMERRAPLPGPGSFVLHGSIVGRHDGICRYTVGQRIPGLIDGRKVYVRRIDAKSNTIELAFWEELFETTVRAEDFNWIVPRPDGPFRAKVRVRHTKWETPACTVYPEADCVRIECDEPVRAPAPGQSAVLYSKDPLFGERVLGGGFIV